ncbi:2-oxoglutarate-dependent ethylene/succinate-forming enzyme [Apiospora kogelbergensis]|uniref:2-oxoglutarate-dependent ethylene/succinate-forming enzyme n=1 Tax=Apiospora kogelbergensis TaxID=1337665 RepID=A0AAW0QK92_9PEZI
MSTVLHDHLTKLGATMPPGYVARVGQIETFNLAEHITSTAGDLAIGRALVDAWRRGNMRSTGARRRRVATFSLSRPYKRLPVWTRRATRATSHRARRSRRYEAGQEPHEGIHYGTHFTNMRTGTGSWQIRPCVPWDPAR